MSLVLVVVGGLLLADAVATLVWQEPVSALYSRLQQGKLDDKLATLEGTEPTAVDRRVLSRLGTLDRRLAYTSRALNRRTDDGDPLGRIRVPSIGVSSVLVEGTDTSSLRMGPGHYPGTPLPGTHGTVAIAGHRTTYGAPFRRLDQLGRGDRIELRMPYGTFVYSVERRRIVAPTAVWVTRSTSYDRLILSACHPLYSAAKRIVVFARLLDTKPKGDRIA
ncbi:MAG: class E sortase [Actinomycetota bacterium]|nr:class E sortase [Actinomycetota bacterium]